MKYILTITALVLGLVATNVSAGTSVNIDGIVQSSTPITQDVLREVPEKSCYISEVPVYGNGKGTAADAIAGALIGGILGNQVGKGDGKDAATIFGAIIGAKVGEENGGKKTIIGYKQIEQCEITYTRRWVSVVTGYSTTVKILLGDGFDDFTPTFKTTREYTVGSTVPVRMSLSLN
jgi:uncharacterized protein YcfJ